MAVKSLSGMLSNESRPHPVRIRISKLLHFSIAFFISGVNFPIGISERFNSTSFYPSSEFLMASCTFFRIYISKKYI